MFLKGGAPAFLIRREEEEATAAAAAAAEAEKVAAEEARRAAAEADPAGAAAKTVKQLKKKMKQVVELQSKIDAGKTGELNEEQKAKLAKRPELEAALKEAEDALASLTVK